MNEPAIVSLTFDDGLRSQIDRAVPILDQYDFPATFFLIANQETIMSGGPSYSQWSKTDWSNKDIHFFKGMVKRGHEIGAHSVTHRHPDLDNDPKLEAEGSKQWIENRLGIEVASYCYPFCHFTDPIKNAVFRAGYKQARWGDHDGYYSLEEQIDHFKIDCRRVGKTNTQIVDGYDVGVYGAENVNDWLRPGCWHVLMFHGIGTLSDGWWPIPVDEFARQMAALAEHRNSGAVDVVTFNDGADRFSRD